MTWKSERREKKLKLKGEGKQTSLTKPAGRDDAVIEPFKPTSFKLQQYTR